MPRNRQPDIDFSSRAAFGDLLLQEWQDRLRYALPATCTADERRELVLEYYALYCDAQAYDKDLTTPKDRKQALRMAYDMLDWFAREYDPRLDSGFREHTTSATFRRLVKRLLRKPEPEFVREDEILGDGSWNYEDSTRQWR